MKRGPTPREGPAFTLLELLVVTSLVAVLASYLLQGLGDGGKSVALQSGQALLSDLITAARVKSAATGRKARLLVNVDVTRPDRFLRFAALQLARQPGASPADWDTVQTVRLPAGVYIAPSSLAGLVADIAAWKRPSDPTAELASDLFSGQSLVGALEGDTAAQPWTGAAFTPNGTLASLAGGLPPKGSIILAPGLVRTPGTFATDQPPITLTNPQAVRGILLSAYGVPAQLNSRDAF